MGFNLLEFPLFQRSSYLPEGVDPLLLSPQLIAELKGFIKHVTGCPYTQGNWICVHFDSSKDASAFVASTCGRQLTMSTHITTADMELCLSAVRAIISSNTFTMP